MESKNGWGAIALLVVAAAAGCKTMAFTSWSSGGGERRIGSCVVSREAIYEEGESEETCLSREAALAEQREAANEQALCTNYYAATQASSQTRLAARDIPGADPAQGILFEVLCAFDRSDVVSQVLLRMHRGETNPIYTAALVMACPADREAYFAWRECREWTAQVDPAALGKALDAATSSDYAKKRFLAAFEKAKQDISALAPAMADHVADYPGLALAYDDVRQELDRSFLPRYREWQPKLAEVEGWIEKLRKGPRFAGTCREDLTAMLQSYVKSVVPKASKNRLAEVMHDPIAFPITASLQYCLLTLGDDEGARMIGYFLGDGEARTGPHFVLRERLAAMQNPLPKLYKGKRMTSSAVFGDKDRTWEGFPLSFPQGTDHVYTVKEKVASLTPRGDQVLVKFKKASGTSYHMEDCKRTGRVSSIDSDGNVHYEENCREVKDKIDLTEKAVWIPASEAKHLAPGFTAAIDADFEPERHGHLLFVLNKSDDLVWAWGFTPRE